MPQVFARRGAACANAPVAWLHVAERDGALFIDNSVVQYTFDLPADGCGLRNITDMAAAFAHCSPPDDQLGGMWSAEFVDAAGFEYVLDNTVLSGVCTYRVFQDTDTNALVTFSWKGVDVGPHTGVLDVTVTLTLQKDNPVTDWAIQVKNSSGHVTVWALHFVNINHLGVGDPSLHNAHVPAGFGQTYTGNIPSTTLQYPGRATMQFVAFTQQEHGLYVATHDQKAYTKSFSVVGDSYVGVDTQHTPLRAITINHTPPDASKALPEWDLAYGVKIALFSGDWFDAAQMYRRWALGGTGPEWVTTPLRARSDVPAWFNETCLWLVNVWNPAVLSYADGDPSYVVNKVHLFRQAFPRVAMALHYYCWSAAPFDTSYPDFLPPRDGWTHAVSQLEGMGVHTLPYINGRLIDYNCTSYTHDDAQKYIAKQFPPRLAPSVLVPYYEQYGSRQVFAVGCPGTTYWPEKVSGVVESIATAASDISGVYIDQVAASPPAKCFDETHGHPLGGGCHWADGDRLLLSKSQEHVRKLDTPGVICSESNAETYMDVMDGMLTIGALAGVPTPMFNAVYSEYTTFFGQYWTDVDLTERDALSFAAKLGQQFVLGVQLGWFNLWELVSPQYAVQAAYLQKCCDYRANNLHFLQFGAMVRPPKLSGVPTVTLQWNVGGNITVALPMVMTSAWYDPGTPSAAFFFTNVSQEAQTLDTTLNFADTGLPTAAGTTYHIAMVAPDGTKTNLGTQTSPTYRLNDTIVGLDVLLLEVSV